jgi:hypothetical protein
VSLMAVTVSMSNASMHMAVEDIIAVSLKLWSCVCSGVGGGIT